MKFLCWDCHNATYKSFLIPESYPSCLHTTLASVLSQRSSQTVPHAPPLHTSTRPSKLFVPPTRRMDPSMQTIPLINYLTYTSYTHLDTSLQHPLNVHSCDLRCVYSLLETVQFHHRPHHPIILVHLPDQSMHCLELFQLNNRRVLTTHDIS